MKSALCLVLSSLICLPAHAQEIETGAIMLCDTQKQVERFAQLYEGDPQAALSAVNTEENDPTACAMVEVAYVEGPQLGTARSRSHAFGIIPIVVVAVATPRGYQPVSPARFFTTVAVVLTFGAN
jgi:hypothetical protein